MNGSLVAADRATHFKIVMLALAAAIVLILVATNAASRTNSLPPTAKAGPGKVLSVHNVALPPRA